MTVDPAVFRALADLLAASAEDLPLSEEAEYQGFGAEAAQALSNIASELTTADLIPAARAAAYRLAAREAASRA